MKSSAFLSALIATTFFCAPTTGAAQIDMRDPHRAMGREDDVRVDAQLVSDVVTSGTPIGLTWQVQNLSESSVAVAEKIAAASYDPDSRTITVSVGSEIPPDGAMPQMAVIAPGEKKTFSIATRLRIVVPAVRSPVAFTPRFVQVKVSVLRDLAPFVELLQRQERARTAVVLPLDDDQFEKWLENSDTIFLNKLPVHYESRRMTFDASQRHGSGGRM